MFSLETERLKIIPLTTELLILCRQTRGLMEKALGLRITSMNPDPPEMLEALEEMIRSSIDDPARWKWHTNWEIALKSENRIVGGAAFYGPPDSDGICETGYIIQESYRNRGFASEAVKAISSWALSNGAKTVKADTEESNAGSIKTLLKCGFIQISNIKGIMTFEKQA